MWIHSILFLFFCGLFIYTKGLFSKSGAYLAGKLPEYLQLTKTQVRLFLMIVFWGNLIGFLYTFAMQSEGDLLSLKRRETAYVEELVVTDGSNRKKIAVEVKTEPYTVKEKTELLEKTLETFPDMILGENKSFQYVEYPLNFVTKIEGTEIVVTWQTSQPMILTWEGNIGETVPKEGTKVQIQAELVIDDCRRIFEETAVVYPKKKTKQEQFVSSVEEALQKQNEKRGDYLILPKKVGESDLTWERGNQYIGIFLVFMAMVIGVLLIASEKSRKKQEKEKRLMQMEDDYPIILNKLLLLMQSGMSGRHAVKKIAADYRKDRKRGKPKRYAYEEFQKMDLKLEQGISEEEVYRDLGIRCELLCYRTLSTLLVQNLKKGSSYFLTALKEECTNAFEVRKNRALVRGEEAGTKLLLPMGGMLLIVLVIILVPSMVALG